MCPVPDKLLPPLVALRRDLHRIPELGYREEKTAARLVRELESIGIPHEYQGVGGGLVVRLEGRDPRGPTVAIRAEMDALPITERTGLPFASAHPGCMHACGHDGHMAMIMGALRLFHADPPAGNLVTIFQPAEEGGGGARVMVERGAMAGVDRIFGGHMTRHYLLGQIMVPQGMVSAQSDHFVFRLEGRGGHGARPHEGSDTVFPSAALIVALQSLITRESDVFHPTVISIGRVNAGTVHNVIADRAVFEGIIRSTVPESSARVKQRMREIAQHTGAAFDVRVEVEFDSYLPAVMNTPEATDTARRAAVATVGGGGVLIGELPSMGSEDFSFYLAEAPGCYVRFGARRPDQPDIPLHSPEFDFDEALLPVGARYFDRVVREAIEGIDGDGAGGDVGTAPPAG